MSAEDTLVPPQWGKREKNVPWYILARLFVHTAVRTRRKLRFHVENCQHADQKQLTRRQAFDFDVQSTHGEPGSWRARPVNVNDGLENVRWIRGLGGEKLPVTSYALLPNLKKG